MSVIPVKTPQGQAEMASRSRQLSQRHRTVLLLVDGKRDAEQVRSMAAQAGAPVQCFEDLLSMGLIAMPVAATEPPAAHDDTVPMELTAIAPRPPSVEMAAPVPMAGSPAAAASDEKPAPAPQPTQEPEPQENYFERTAALYGPVDRPDLLPPPPQPRQAGVMHPPPAVSPRAVLSEQGDDSVLSARPDRSLFGEVEAEPFDSINSMFADQADAYESSLEEARAVLIRAVRAEAPVAGSLTLMRLRRARTASELADMLDEVEARITRPSRTLSAQQTLRRVRQLLLMAGHHPPSTL